MRRVGKLMYEWMGFDHLPTLLEQLAQEEETGVPVEDRIRRAPTIIIVNEQVGWVWLDGCWLVFLFGGLHPMRAHHHHHQRADGLGVTPTSSRLDG